MKHNVDEADLAMAYSLNVVENIKCYSLHVYSSKKKKKKWIISIQANSSNSHCKVNEFNQGQPCLLWMPKSLSKVKK